MKPDKTSAEDALATVKACEIFARLMCRHGVDDYLREQDQDEIADLLEFLCGKPEEAAAVKAKKPQ